MAQRSELNYLIYNDPLGYADLILNGDPEEYLKNVTGSHGLEDWLCPGRKIGKGQLPSFLRFYYFSISSCNFRLQLL